MNDTTGTTPTDSGAEKDDSVLDPAKGADQQWPDEAKILPNEYLGDDKKPA